MFEDDLKIELVPFSKAKEDDFKILDEIAQSASQKPLKYVMESYLFEWKGYGLVEDLIKKIGHEEEFLREWNPNIEEGYYQRSGDRLYSHFEDRDRKIFIDKSLLPNARLKYIREYLSGRHSGDDPTTNNYLIKDRDKPIGFVSIFDGLFSATGEVGSPAVECLVVKEEYSSCDKMSNILMDKVSEIEGRMKPFKKDPQITSLENIIPDIEKKVRIIGALNE